MSTDLCGEFPCFKGTCQNDECVCEFGYGGSECSIPWVDIIGRDAVLVYRIIFCICAGVVLGISCYQLFHINRALKKTKNQSELKDRVYKHYNYIHIYILLFKFILLIL